MFEEKLTAREWLRSNLFKYDTKTELIEACCDELNVTPKRVKRIFKEIKEEYEDHNELISQNVKLAKQKQFYQDSNRIERKSFRDYARVENAINQYSKALLNDLNKINLNKYTKVHTNKNGHCEGIIQISDTHFNEIVDLPENNYDMELASARLKKFADKTITILKSNDVTKVLIVFTGDLMNSDRRIDEALSMAANRSKATFIAVDLLKQFILHINEHFNVGVASVCGNESRVNKDFGWTERTISDNYDFTIFNILRFIFKDSDINFIVGDSGEQIINVNGSNVLLYHGNGGKPSNPDKMVSDTIARYSVTLGIKIDYILFGHLHSAYVSDYFARSASLVGGNAYSSRGLNLYSKASQNVLVVEDNGSIDAYKIDLQNCDIKNAYDTTEIHKLCDTNSSKLSNNIYKF